MDTGYGRKRGWPENESCKTFIGKSNFNLLRFVNIKYMLKKPDYSVPALERGLDVIEILANQRRPLTLTDIAELTGHPANGLFRITDCLAKRGYLSRNSTSGAFRLSLRLYQLAHTHSPVESLILAAREPMCNLVAQLGESCHLSVFDGTDLVIIDQVAANRAVRLSIEVGARFAATRTASGRLLLANLGKEARDALLKRLPKGVPVPVPAELDRLRKDGFCSAYEETVRGVADVAVLVGNPEVGVLAALTVSALSPPSPKNFTKRILPILRAAATCITRETGLEGGTDASTFL